MVRATKQVRGLMSEGQKERQSDDGKLLYCSFCGKSQHEVRKLIAGPSVFICDECVELCNDIIREEMQESGVGERGQAAQAAEINAILDEYVIGQEARQEGALGRGLQPLQAPRRPRPRRRRRDLARATSC
jgi:hypothetical protein